MHIICHSKRSVQSHQWECLLWWFHIACVLQRCNRGGKQTNITHWWCLYILPVPVAKFAFCTCDVHEHTKQTNNPFGMRLGCPQDEMNTVSCSATFKLCNICMARLGTMGRRAYVDTKRRAYVFMFTFVKDCCPSIEQDGMYTLGLCLYRKDTVSMCNQPLNVVHLDLQRADETSLLT